MKERNKRNTASDGRETGRRPGSRKEGSREGRSGFRKGSHREEGFRKGAEWKMPALPVLLLAAAVLVVILVAALWKKATRMVLARVPTLGFGTTRNSNHPLTGSGEPLLAEQATLMGRLV